MKELIIKLYSEGKSYREIEKITGLNRGSISYYLNPKTPLNRRKQRKERRAIIKKRCIEHKGGKCHFCLFNKFQSALDFHHLNPKIKKNCITTLIAKNQSFDLIKPELDKCILVCANCHRGLHSGEIKLDE
jgi:predicted HNH restriction endonuclease